MKNFISSSSGNGSPGRAASRRDFINQTMGGIAFLGAGRVLAGSEELNITEQTSKRKLKIVVAGGHPGDPEYGCGGTIARYTDLGHEVVLLYLNRGEGGIAGKSGREAGTIRSAEALNACAILNARAVFATQIDGQSVVDEKHAREFFEILSAEKPDIIFTQWPVDNHPDHRAIASLVYDAWLKIIRSGSSVKPVFCYYEVSNGEDTLMFTPNYYVDITPQEERKHKACFAHASQAPEKFYALQDQVSQFRGFEFGCRKAEGFIVHVWSGKELL